MGAQDIFTLEAIATEVGQTYGSTNAISLTKIKRWINRAILEITNYGEWLFLVDGDETFDTEATTAEYCMPCNIKEIKKLYYRDEDYDLHYVPYDKWIDAIIDDTENSGRPTHYTIVGWDQYSRGWKIRLWPVPDAVKTIYISADKFIPLFEADEDDLRDRMPETMLPLVIAIAEKFALKDLDDITEATRIAETRALLTEYHGKQNTQRNLRLRAKPHEEPDVNRALDPILPPNYS